VSLNEIKLGNKQDM